MPWGILQGTLQEVQKTDRRGSGLKTGEVEDAAAGRGHEGGEADGSPSVFLGHRATPAQLLRSSPQTGWLAGWATAPAQREAAPRRAGRLSQHLVPIKLLISSSSATALGWIHPAHGSVSTGQLELPCSLLGPPTGHPGHQLATHYSIIAGNSEVSSQAERRFLLSDSAPQGPQRLPSKARPLVSLLSQKKILKKLNFRMFVLAKNKRCVLIC